MGSLGPEAVELLMQMGRLKKKYGINSRAAFLICSKDMGLR